MNLSSTKIMSNSFISPQKVTIDMNEFRNGKQLYLFRTDHCDERKHHGRH